MRCLLPVFAVFVSSATLAAYAEDTPAAPAAATTATSTTSDAEVVQAARAADLLYQRRVSLLSSQLISDDTSQRIAAIRALRQLDDPAIVGLLLPRLRNDIAPDELLALLAALPAGCTDAVPSLRALVKHDHAEVRVAATSALERAHAGTAALYLQQGTDSETALRASAAVSLSLARDGVKIDDVIAVLRRGLSNDRSPHVRRMCAIAVTKLGDAAHGNLLADALFDSDAGVRRYAAQGVVRLKYLPAVPLLLLACESTTGETQAVFADALQALTNHDFGLRGLTSPLARQTAVEQGLAWWTANKKNLGA